MGFGIGKKVYVPKDRSFDNVINMAIQDAADINNDCCDYFVRGLSGHEPLFEGNDIFSLQIGRSRETFKLTRWSRNQLCQAIKVPSKYINYLLDNPYLQGQELARTNINQMLAHCDSSLNLRVYKNRIRGIVSTSYSTFDTIDILKVLKELAYSKEYLGLRKMVCTGYCINEEMFNLRLIFNECLQGVRDKDLHLGLSITTSDIGKSSIRIESWIYREMCSNGTYSISGENSLYWQKHQGVHPESIKDKIVDVLLRTPEIINYTCQSIRKAENYSLVNSELLNPNYKRDFKRYKLREEVAEHLRLSNEAMNEVAEIAVANYEPDLWGYCSAVTQYAQTLDNILARVLLEDAAGTLVVKLLHRVTKRELLK